MNCYKWRGFVWKRLDSRSNIDLTPSIVTNQPRETRRLLAKIGRRTSMRRLRLGIIGFGCLALWLLPGALTYSNFPAGENNPQRSMGHSISSAKGPGASAIAALRVPAVEEISLHSFQPNAYGAAGDLQPGVVERLYETKHSGWKEVELSVYSAHYHGGRTASGKRYDHYKGFTAATSRQGKKPRLPFGSRWEVRYHGRTVQVTITDTGSWKPKRADHWLDLSGAAWNQLTHSSPSRIVAEFRRID